MFAYLIIGLLFYFFMCMLNLKSFRHAGFIEILRGALFGIIFWPIAIIYISQTKIKKLLCKIGWHRVKEFLKSLERGE